MKKPVIFSLAMIALFFALPFASAHCPACTAGAVIGIGIARAYGVDDSIVGLFLGALIVSSALWFNRWFKKKANFPLQEVLIVILSFLLLAVPFYYKGVITNFEMVKSMPENHGITGLGILGLSQLGIDRLLFGMIVGTLSLWGVFTFSDNIKKKRGDVLWPYQGMSFMFITLVILSLIFWILTKNLY